MQHAPEKATGEDGLPVPPYKVYNIGNSAPENLLDFVTILQEELIAAKVLPSDYDFEVYKGKYIFYGLGNFYFDNPQKRNCSWNKGLLLSVDFGETINCKLIPFTQCDSQPNIILDSFESIKGLIKELNDVIDDDTKLQQSYNEMVMKELPLSPMQPYTSHYVRALYHRNLLPDLVSKKKKAEILNLVRCETHRELLIAYLTQKL